MAEDSEFNPFAAFAFHPGKNDEPKVKLLENNSKITTVVEHDPLCLWSGVNHCNDTSAHPTTMTRSNVDVFLSEYRLIADFRTNGPKSIISLATVDEFNSFLLTLHGSVGRYFALVACVLSVQCLDSVALKVVNNLMELAPKGAIDVAAMVPDQEGNDPLANVIRSLNFYNTKVKYIRNFTKIIITEYHGEVPMSQKELLKLSGVGPKIANLMRSVSFGCENAGIVVDTHVFRLSRELGWVPKPKDKATNRFFSSSSSSSVPQSSSSSSSMQGVGSRNPLKRSRLNIEDNADSPERTRVLLEKWVSIKDRKQFSLNLIGFSQIIRKASLLVNTTSSKEKKQPLWVVEFLKFVQLNHFDSLTIAENMVNILLQSQGGGLMKDKQPPCSLSPSAGVPYLSLAKDTDQLRTQNKVVKEQASEQEQAEQEDGGAPHPQPPVCIVIDD